MFKIKQSHMLYIILLLFIFLMVCKLCSNKNLFEGMTEITDITKEDFFKKYLTLELLLQDFEIIGENKEEPLGCVDTRRRGELGWLYKGSSHAIDNARERCKDSEYVSIECPNQDNGRAHVFCLNEWDNPEIKIPDGNCTGDMTEINKSEICNGQNSSCHPTHFNDKSVTADGGCHRGAVYPVNKKNSKKIQLPTTKEDITKEDIVKYYKKQKWEELNEIEALVVSDSGLESTNGMYIKTSELVNGINKWVHTENDASFFVVMRDAWNGKTKDTDYIVANPPDSGNAGHNKYSWWLHAEGQWTWTNNKTYVLNADIPKVPPNDFTYNNISQDNKDENTTGSTTYSLVNSSTSPPKISYLKKLDGSTIEYNSNFDSETNPKLSELISHVKYTETDDFVSIKDADISLPRYYEVILVDKFILQYKYLDEFNVSETSTVSETVDDKTSTSDHRDKGGLNKHSMFEKFFDIMKENNNIINVSYIDDINIGQQIDDNHQPYSSTIDNLKEEEIDDYINSENQDSIQFIKMMKKNYLKNKISNQQTLREEALQEIFKNNSYENCKSLGKPCPMNALTMGGNWLN